MAADPTDPTPERRTPPPPLTTSAGIAAVQGMVTVLIGIADIVRVQRDALLLGIGGGLFFAAYGVGLILGAYGLYRLRPWSRGPVLFAELIWLGVAWSYRGSPTTVFAVVIAISAAIALAGLLTPTSVDALNRPEHRE